MEHDFVRFPELTNEELQNLYFESPHRQITEDFPALVQKVIDGDTIKVLWYGRTFPFKVRIANIDAPELSEGGNKSKSWLERKLLGKEVYIEIDPNNRIGRWGRLIGKVIHQGMDVGEESILAGMSVAWDNRHDGKIIDPVEQMREELKKIGI